MLVIGGYYDKRKGWENSNIGWYEHTVILSMPLKEDHFKDNPVLWLQKQNNYKHVRFIVYDDITRVVIKVKFRYEKDYIIFKLTW
jgi:hypothetical protein